MAEFTGIERTPRFETLPILDRDVEIRVKFSIKEMGTLAKYLAIFDKYSGRLTEKATDSDIKNYESAVSDCVQLLIKQEDDKAFVKDAVLDANPDSDDIIDVREFVQLIKHAMKTDDEGVEEDTGKASSGQTPS